MVSGTKWLRWVALTFSYKLWTSLGGPFLPLLPSFVVEELPNDHVSQTAANRGTWTPRSAGI